MTREDARHYLQSSGFSEEQIVTIEQAFKQEPKAEKAETQGDDRWLLHFGQNIVIPSAEPKWIPVERLPEDDGLYLVYTEEQPFVCPFKDGEFFIDEVLAWMPLPKPYEPQERSE